MKKYDGKKAQSDMAAMRFALDFIYSELRANCGNCDHCDTVLLLQRKLQKLFKELNIKPQELKD